MSHLWTVADMARAMGANVRGEPPVGVTGLSIDSRTIADGEAYFAIRGDAHDGHAFVAGAHGNRAALSVVAGDKVETLKGETGTLLVVDEVLPALEKLGIAARDRFTGQTVAITGSVGKTTTKEALRTALAPSGTVHASVSSFNNHWGVPLTLARTPADAVFGIYEIGMNHPGEITPLVGFVRPQVAVITNVAAAHLGAFDSVDRIAHAKAEIFNGLDDAGTAVLNADDPRLPLLTDLARKAGVKNIVTFGEADGADTRLQRLVEHPNCSCVTADIMGQPMTLKVGAPGKHIVQNVLAVLTICRLFGADLALAGLALANLGAVKGRGERHELFIGNGTATLIDESYNANPASQRAALKMLGLAEPTAARGRRIAVLGDMLELGDTSKKLHEELASTVRENADMAFLAGEDMAALAAVLRAHMPVIHTATAGELASHLLDEVREGDVIMAKASLSLGFASIVKLLLDKHGQGTA
jgi:UDP-N-acetylmuramoyl-tripeptide--D-alanyl-D-alanine ligase